jgi:hypothetical protein
MDKHNIENLILEIDKVKAYVWDRVQSDYLLNNHGAFLFRTYVYEELINKIDQKIEEKKLPEVFKQYTINRWYNFACSLVIQSLLENHDRVKAEENRKSLTKDIFIDEKPFDFKISYVFKGSSEKMFLRNLNDPTDFIIKYYKGGGKQRMHSEPKLFMIFADKYNHKEHQWEMKRDFDTIKKFITLYLDGTKNTEYLKEKEFSVGDNNHIIKMADLFYIIKDNNKRFGIYFNWKNNIPAKTEIEIN